MMIVNKFGRPFHYLLLAVISSSFLIVPVTTGAKGKSKAKPRPKLKSTEKDKARHRMLRYSQEDIDLDIKIERKRNETIRLLVKLLKDFPKNHPKRADMLRRLAELYWEKAKFMYLQKMRIYNKRYSAWLDSGSKGPEPKLDLRSIQVFNKKAINICEAILRQYPDYKKLDEALFFLGYNYGEIGKKSKALSYYKRITKQFPNSSHVAEAWLQIGEYYFDANNVYDALQAYKKAVTFTSAKTFGYAMYKLAWCYYNLGEYKKAIDLFKKVVSYSIEQEKEKKSKIQLREEALKDLVRTYADDENVEDAEAYFKSVGGGKYLRMMYKLLAKAYWEQGKDEQCIDIYKRLIALDPLHPETPEYHLAMIRAYKRMGNKKRVVKEIVRLLDIYAVNGQWAKANKDQKELLEETRDTLEANLRQIVISYHKEYQKRKSRRTRKYTRELYELYLKYFPDRPYAKDLRYFYADLLFSGGEWDLSYDQYMKVVDELKNSKKKRDRQRLELAAYNSIIAMEKQLTAAEKRKMTLREDARKVRARVAGSADKRKDLEKEGRKEKDIKPKPIPKKFKRLIAACENYIKLVPESQYKIEIRYKAAKIYYDYNHFDKAAKTFYGIVKNHPTHKLAELAANLILDSLNMGKNWSELNKRAREFRKNRKLVRNRTFAKLLDKLIMQSQYMMALALEKQKKYSLAAESFITFVKDWPKSSYCGKALYSAAAFLANAGKIEASIKLRERLNKEYPKFEYIPDNIFHIAELYQRLVYWSKAAQTYERLANEYPKHEKAADALFNAGVLWQNLGRRKRSIKDFKDYIDRFPKRPDAPGLLLSIGDMLMEENNPDEAFKTYEEWLKKFGKADDKKTKEQALAVRFKIAKAMWEKGGKDKEKAEKTFVQIVEKATDPKIPADEKSTVLLSSAAEASFLMAEKPLQEYLKMKLKLPMKRLEAGLKKKAKALLEMKKRYETIVSYRQAEWAIAALYKLGEANQNFARTLYDAPIPPELTPEQADIYTQGLQNKAMPIEERAAEAYKKAVNKSFELGMYSKWTKKALEKLSELKPNTYPLAREIKPSKAAVALSFFAPSGPAALSGKSRQRAEKKIMRQVQRAAPTPAAPQSGK
ncbi:MAG: tetratricopeptide repeat protein [Deltaproteobacteria bacterium]|nr:tetratricopeptide repeat protein [Deltaproteobacteria bacterium]